MGGPENPSAFPSGDFVGVEPGYGMTLRDWFAAMAPTPDGDVVHIWQQSDRARNPHNDSHKPKLRSKAEIIAMLAYEHADAMLAARGHNS